jgi:flagellar basal-body rod protein FlgC
MKFILAFVFSLPLFAHASTQTDACMKMNNSRMEMNVIASNIANVNSTRTPAGGPYKRKEFVCVDLVCDLAESRETLSRYEPDHPDANENGYVLYPDIDLMHEMESMIHASRDFDAAVAVCKPNVIDDPRIPPFGMPRKRSATAAQVDNLRDHEAQSASRTSNQ